MKLALLFLTALLIHSRAIADLKVQVRFSPVANLVYQLNCVSSEFQHCSRETYKNLWKTVFIKSDTDRNKIKEWADLMGRYSSYVELKDRNQKLGPGHSEGISLSSKLQIASFQSMSLDEYLTRLDLIVAPKDRLKFETVIRHFYPAFSKWWKETALPKGKKFSEKTQSLLLSKKVSNKIRKFAHFYQVQLPENYLLQFNLLFRPVSNETASGQQIENYSIAEFVEGEKPENRIDVIIHELCHFFYDNTSDQNIASAYERFLNENSVAARSAYNLLNEALATALGNGIITRLHMEKKKWEKHLTQELSFYYNANIDKASKAILPWLEKWVDDGKTLYDSGFVKEYLTALTGAFGTELTAPRMVLNALIADGKYRQRFRDVVQKAVRASSMHSSEGSWSDPRLLQTYNKRKDLSALIIVHPANLNQLKKQGLLSDSDFNEIKKQYRVKKKVVYSFQRAPSVPAYVIVADDYENATALIEKLASLKEGFTGALVEL